MVLTTKKAGTEYRVIFRQPGCLSKTRRLSAPFLRMVEYYRLSIEQAFLQHYISMRICQYFSNIQLRDCKSALDLDPRLARSLTRPNLNLSNNSARYSSRWVILGRSWGGIFASRPTTINLLIYLQLQMLPTNNNRPLLLRKATCVHYGSPARTRTTDMVVNSHPLYRLSYWGIKKYSFSTTSLLCQ